ncbi:MAG: TolC family protein, partial [Calditrichia bacterium]|nr:TolC family protein [Calditrichia bacterium]
NFTRVAGDLFTIRALPEPEWLLGALENSPRIIEQSAVITSRKAETELARAKAIPDPVLIAGYRHFNQTDNEAFVAGLSVPLPIFDRNQGGKKEALFRELQSEQQMQNLRNLLSAELNIRMENLQNFSTEIQTMRNVIIPEAQKAYDIIYKNYRLGNYAIIDVLDAQRQLFDAEGRYIDNLARINLEIIELEGILGQSLKSF